jgi:membrane protein YqaA with SNARE-associated domain
MYKKLYLKSLELAAHKSSEFYLALVSFIESSFFPIPPDVMIVPMVMARKDRFIRIFLNATIFSVLGGIFGYFIGFIFSDLAMSVVEFYNYEDKVNNLKARLSEESGLYIWLITLFLAGFTPLPFKVFTITSGLISFNIFIFIIICLISRGLRFFIVSYFTFRFGEPFVNFIEKKGALWSTVVGLLLIPLFILIYFIIK